MVFFITLISVTYLLYILLPLFATIIEKIRELRYGKRKKVKEVDPKIQKEIDFLYKKIAEVAMNTAKLH